MHTRLFGTSILALTLAAVLSAACTGKSRRDRHHRNRCRRPRFPNRHGSFAERRQDDQRQH